MSYHSALNVLKAPITRIY